MLRLSARSFNTIFIAGFAFFAIIFTSFASHAQGLARLKTGSGGFVSIGADNSIFNRDGEKKTIELTGHVQIVFDDQFISCDRATIDETTQTIYATGNLVVSSPQAYVEGDSATINYRDNTGVIQNGFVKSGQVIVEGKVVRKTGNDTYEGENASFTACTTCPTAWTFSGSRINAEMGGYAHIRNAWLRVANVPIFWLPYLIVPLKSERQTGLLVPSFDYTESGGFAPSLNYFWAISRSQDATFTLTHYAKRGVKGLVNYRYVLNQTSEGELNYGFIRDRVFEGTPAYQPVGTKANRWFTTYFHNYDMPGGYNQKLKLNFVSDLRYPRDFPMEVQTVGDPSLENRLTLTRNTERTHASVDTSYYINQLKTNPLADNKDAVHRWPELRFSLVERPVMQEGPLSRVLFNVTTDYANFAREDFAFDDVYLVGGTATVDTTRTNPGANTFDPATDVIRAGQRFDVQPQLSLPFRLGSSIDILPSVQFRHTQYSLNVTPPPGSNFEAAPYRQYLRTQLSTRSRFSRIYGDRAPEAQAPRPSVTNWVDAESRAVGDPALQVVAPPQPRNLYRHEVEPEILLAGVAPLGQTENSQFFGDVSQVPVFLDNQPVSNSDFLTTRKGIQFDYEDRM
ncbi:MAG: LPS assembly protein LptD, partial [Bdellovibrionota bacterium]